MTQRKLTTISTLFIIFMLSHTPTASADVGADFDCYLTHSDLECSDIRSALREALPGVTFVVKDRSRLVIALRDVEAGQGRRFFVELSGVPLGSVESVRYRLSQQIAHSAGHDRSLALVVALCQRALVPFLKVDRPGVIKDGQLSLQVGARGDKPRAREPSRWFFEPSIRGGLFIGNLTNVDIGAATVLNYSDPSWRAIMAGSANYRYLDLDLGDTSLKGDFLRAQGELLVARSLSAGLSVAAKVDAKSEPQNNLDLRSRLLVGAEWLHAPFLHANETNFGARLWLAGIYDAYVAPTQTENATARLYLEPLLEVLARFHTNAVDFELSGGGAFPLHAPAFWRLWAGTSVAVRIAEGLQLKLSASMVLRGMAINAPSDSSRLNAVAATSGSNLNQVTFNSEVGLSWTLGNSLLRAQDQRWR